MRETFFADVSEILDSFDIEEISRLLTNQINNDEDITYTHATTEVNYLLPLHQNYIKLKEANDVEEDTMKEAEYKYFQICRFILKEICDKYNLSINENLLENNYADIPKIALQFYHFFILDFNMNLYQVIVNYIMENAKEIIKNFEGMKTKKDMSYLSNNTSLSNEMGLILSNIYDISEWILIQMSEEEYFELLEEEYIPLELIKNLYLSGDLAGEFVDKIYDIYHNNIALKSGICFDIIYNIKNGTIKDNFIVTE